MTEAMGTPDRKRRSWGEFSGKEKALAVAVIVVVIGIIYFALVPAMRGAFHAGQQAVR